METKTKTFPNGAKHTYKLTREKGFFTSHIWVWRDGKPFLHFMPSDQEGWSREFKNVEGYGYMPNGEINRSFDKITLENISLY